MKQESKIQCLDHGYASLVQRWGSDEQIIEAARMSTGKGFLGWGPRCSKCGVSMVELFDGTICAADYERGEQKKCEHDADKSGDEKLLRYLWEHKHSTPFEMAGLTVEIKAPIFVFRQWYRHRTQSYNEMSARYTALPDECYLPTAERLLADGGKNKQAGTVKGAAELDENMARRYLFELECHYAEARLKYEKFLSLGVPKELARLHLPMAQYSVMRASANLRNWLHFLTLRVDGHAQYEIRVYAEVVLGFVRECFPRTAALFEEGRIEQLESK